MTTEVFLRGPGYKAIWVSVGIDVVAGVSQATVREAVKAALLAFLSPLPARRTATCWSPRVAGRRAAGHGAPARLAAAQGRGGAGAGRRSPAAWRAWRWCAACGWGWPPAPRRTRCR